MAKVEVEETFKVLVEVNPEAVKEAADNDPEKLAPAPTKAEVTVNDDPTPRLPEKLPVPITSRLRVVVEVPIPTLPAK